MEEVVTTGYRRSLINSIDAKRDSGLIIEAVTAEDIGKLPDQSIADSIARLPGIAAQRLDGRASNISIRGLGENFSATTINGREQVTIGDNRGVEFDIYPSEMAQTLTVYKTPNAALTSQGIAGTIDMQTTRPLKLDDRVIKASVFYEQNEIGALNPDGENSGVRYTFTYADQYGADDTFGLAVIYNDTASPSNEERWNAWGYPDNGPDGTRTLGGAKPFVRTSEFNRDTLIVTAQWQVSDNSSLTFDSMSIDFADEKILRGIEVPGTWGGPGPFIPDPDSIIGGRVTEGEFQGRSVVIRNDYEIREAELTAQGINWEWQISDRLHLNVDWATSEVERQVWSLESYATASGHAGEGFTGREGFNNPGDRLETLLAAQKAHMDGEEGAMPLSAADQEELADLQAMDSSMRIVEVADSLNPSGISMARLTEILQNEGVAEPTEDQIKMRQQMLQMQRDALSSTRVMELEQELRDLEQQGALGIMSKRARQEELDMKTADRNMLAMMEERDLTMMEKELAAMEQMERDVLDGELGQLEWAAQQPVNWRNQAVTEMFTGANCGTPIDVTARNQLSDVTDKYGRMNAGTALSAAAQGQRLGCVQYAQGTVSGVRFFSDLNYADWDLTQLGGAQTWGNNHAMIDGRQGQDGFINLPLINDELDTFRADLAWERDAAYGLTKVTGGFYMSDHTKMKDDRGRYLVLQDHPNTLVVPEGYREGSVDLNFIGFPAAIAYDSFQFWQDGGYENLEPGAADLTRITNDYTVTEEIAIFYGMADFEFDWLAGASLNFGLQFVNTDQTAEGMAVQVEDGKVVTVPVEGGDDYGEVLHSLSFNLDLTEQWKLRAAHSSTMSRTRFDRLLVAGTWGFDNGQNVPGGSPFTYTSGNPTLRPNMATQFDLSLEWYFRDDGYVSIAFYTKDLDNWQAQRTIPFDIAEFVDPSLLEEGVRSTLGTHDTWVETEGGEIDGFELSVSLPFGVFHDSLDGLGMVASWTDVSSSLEDPTSGNDIMVPGLSPNITNVTAYYEKAGWEARVSVRSRDDFLGERFGISFSRENVNVIGDTLWDAQLTYDFSALGKPGLDGLKLNFQAQNITDEPYETRDGGTGLTTDYQVYGRTLQFGLSYQF